jgi:hypothetical protein
LADFQNGAFDPKLSSKRSLERERVLNHVDMP